MTSAGGLPLLENTPHAVLKPQEYSYADSMSSNGQMLEIHVPESSAMESVPLTNGNVPKRAFQDFTKHPIVGAHDNPWRRRSSADVPAEVSSRAYDNPWRRRSSAGVPAEVSGREFSLEDSKAAARAAWQRLPFGHGSFRLRNTNSRKLLAFILINSTFSVAEMLYGLATSRIALVSDAFHLSFGCGVLSLSLVAIVYARRQPDADYTYGYDRLDVLAGFTNALFLLFLSFSLAVEALHAFIEDESEHRHYLTLSAAANLLVNLMGVYFFRQFSRIYVVYQRSQDMNHHSIFLHVLSDSLRSAGIILASWLLAVGVPYAETLVNLAVSGGVLAITLPLFYASGGVLLQTLPAGIPPGALDKCLREAVMCEGAVECTDPRFWSLVPGAMVGTVIVQAKADADEQHILQHVHGVFNNLGVSDMTVQIEKRH